MALKNANKDLKPIAERAFTNHQAKVGMAHLKDNLEKEFHMTDAQERRLEAQKKKIGMMIKKLAAYAKKTAKVEQVPPSWKK